MAAVRTSWRRGLLADIAGSAEVGADLERRGERVLAAARAAAPVASGAFRDSLRLQVDRTGDRVAARISTNDPGGLVIDIEHRVLARALEAARD